MSKLNDYLKLSVGSGLLVAAPLIGERAASPCSDPGAVCAPQAPEPYHGGESGSPSGSLSFAPVMVFTTSTSSI